LSFLKIRGLAGSRSQAYRPGSAFQQGSSAQGRLIRQPSPVSNVFSSLIAGTVDAAGTGKTDSRKIPDATMLRDHGVNVAESAVRGALRILGTCLGAGLAVALTPLAFSDLAGRFLRARPPAARHYTQG
jgi:hypothetical protein